MTVNELREILGKFDGDLIVCIDDSCENHDYCECMRDHKFSESSEVRKIKNEVVIL